MAKINKQLLKDIRPAIDDALAEVAARFGVQIKAGNASYELDGSTAKMTINFSAIDEASGEVADPLAVEYDRWQKLFPHQYVERGTVIHFAGRDYKIIGMARGGRSKYPIIAERVIGPRGKRFKLPAEASYTENFSAAYALAR
jgi:hypothetical protein